MAPYSPSLARLVQFARSIRSPFKKSITIRKTPSPEPTISSDTSAGNDADDNKVNNGDVVAAAKHGEKAKSLRVGVGVPKGTAAEYSQIDDDNSESGTHSNAYNINCDTADARAGYEMDCLD